MTRQEHDTFVKVTMNLHANLNNDIFVANDTG